MSKPLTIKEVVANLGYFIENSDDADTAAAWYFTAREECAVAAKDVAVPMDVFTAMVAALSPMMKWQKNIPSAIQIATIQNIEGIPTFRRNRVKALRIWETGRTSLLTGPKVVIFWRTLLDPMYGEPTIDTWMLRAGGYFINQERTPLITEMRVVAEATNVVAGKNHWTLAGTQAVVWESVRSYWNKHVGRGNPFIHPVSGRQVA